MHTEYEVKRVNILQYGIERNRQLITVMRHDEIGEKKKKILRRGGFIVKWPKSSSAVYVKYIKFRFQTLIIQTAVYSDYRRRVVLYSVLTVVQTVPNFRKTFFFFSKLVNIFSLGCYEPQILLWHNVRYWINRRSTVFVRLDVVGSTGVFFLVRRHIWTASARHASPGAK